MSENTGRTCAFIMLLWLAVYVGTGKAHENHDEIIAGLYTAFMALLLYLPRSQPRRERL